MMTDFHTHILPGIDDGSRNIEMSKEMIQMEMKQGIKKIAFTPHFYAHQDDQERFLARRKDAYELLVHTLSEDIDFELSEVSVPEFKLGAEVFLFPGIGNSRKLIDLCFEDTRVLLLEMPFSQWTNNTYREVKEIIEKQELTVVLAHVERYKQYQKDTAVWKEILQLPVISQLNAESLFSWRTRRFAYKFIEKGHEILLGSDAHNISSRPVNIGIGRDVLKKKYGEKILIEIDKVSERLWWNNES